MKQKIDKKVARGKRHRRVRKTVSGNEQRLRLAVFRSNKHIYAQLINDRTGQSLLMVSSLSAEVKGDLKGTGNISAAKAVGAALAVKAIEKGITRVVFDRGGYIYHGRVKALADAAREKGLSF